ncbi:MAG TPA: ATP-binding protein, partial [Nocardioides sp.]|nr:ATP-binding protein [Nocardioides sp.]
MLAGPSGAGKSRLAARLQDAHGWPILRLDDFYRDEDDPRMPRSEQLGIVDWDHPDSWNRGAALDALATLVTTGRVTTPVYDIAASRAVGSAELTAQPHDLILA